MEFRRRLRIYVAVAAVLLVWIGVLQLARLALERDLQYSVPWQLRLWLAELHMNHPRWPFD